MQPRFNNTHREKLCFTQFNTKDYENRSLAASDLFHNLFQLDRKWISTGFTEKFELVFVLTQKKAFS